MLGNSYSPIQFTYVNFTKVNIRQCQIEIGEHKIDTNNVNRT